MVFRALGTVMYFEPSLFVYFAVALEVGDVGDWAVCCCRFAGIPIRTELLRGYGRTDSSPNTEIRDCKASSMSRERDRLGEETPETHKEG
jgi:hypothetical protein